MIFSELSRTVEEKQARTVLPGRESIYSKWRLDFVLKSSLLGWGQYDSDKVVEVWRFYLCVWLQGPARATGSELSAVSLGERFQQIHIFHLEKVFSSC